MNNQIFSIKIVVWALSILLLGVSNDKTVAMAETKNEAAPLTIRVLGTGDCWGEYPTAFLIKYKGKRILIDCGKSQKLTGGKSIPDSLLELDEKAPIDFVLLTHFHTDHIGGLPDLHSKGLAGDKMHIVGDAQGFLRYSDTLPSLGIRSPLLYMKSKKYNFTSITRGSKYKFEDFGIEVETFRMQHVFDTATHDPVYPLGYRIRFEYEGIVVAFTGDTEYCGNIAKVVKGADLAFIECTGYKNNKSNHTTYLEDLEKKVFGYKPKNWPLNIIHYGQSMEDHKKEVEHPTAEWGPRLRLAVRDDIFTYGANGFQLNGRTLNHILCRPALEAFCTNINWEPPLYLRKLADVNGDGRADIVGFGWDGTYVSLAKTKDQITDDLPVFHWPIKALPDAFCSSGEWKEDTYPRELADINGDGRADIVGFGSPGVSVALATGDPKRPFDKERFVLKSFGYDYSAGGWLVGKHPRMLDDVNGDGKADIVGFASDGVLVALAKDNDDHDHPFNEPERWIYAYGYQSTGWRVNKHPRMLADVNGDKKADIVGFGDFGVHVTQF